MNTKVLPDIFKYLEDKGLQGELWGEGGWGEGEVGRAGWRWWIGDRMRGVRLLRLGKEGEVSCVRKCFKKRKHLYLLLNLGGEDASWIGNCPLQRDFLFSEIFTYLYCTTIVKYFEMLYMS